jgi:hypothetical protein
MQVCVHPFMLSFGSYAHSFYREKNMVSKAGMNTEKTSLLSTH